MRVNINCVYYSQSGQCLHPEQSKRFGLFRKNCTLICEAFVTCSLQTKFVKPKGNWPSPPTPNPKKSREKISFAIVCARCNKTLRYIDNYLDGDVYVPVCTCIQREAEQGLIRCSLCGKPCNARFAHLHQGKYIGDECCWDERLHSSE